jgi:hypothetical protein
MMRQEDAGWSNPRVIAILAIVFLCGSAFGAAIMREYLHSRMLIPGHTFVYHGKQVSFDTLRSQLHLTSSQEQTVSSVLDDFAKFYQNMEEEREDVAESGKRRIFAVLDDSQQQRFYQLFNERPPTAHP